MFLFILFFHFMFFFQRNWSPLLFIFRSSSFPVIQVNVDIKILWKERLVVVVVVVFLSKSPGGHVIYRRNERGAWNAKICLSYSILLPRRADCWLPSPFPRVCKDGRSDANVITKFSRMDRLQIFLSYTGLHSRALRTCFILSLSLKQTLSRWKILLKQKEIN